MVRALTMLTALMLLQLLVMTALLVSREQAAATTLVVSLLLLVRPVRGYSMSHRYTSQHGKAKPRMLVETRTPPQEGKVTLDGPERKRPGEQGPCRERDLSGHNEKSSRTLHHTPIVPTHHQIANCLRFAECHEGAMLADGTVLYSVRA
jgi:hypothetical protein